VVKQDWREQKYQETLDAELRGLARRREADPSCTAGDLRGILDGLYRSAGADWLGRGELQDIVLAATIAAYEITIEGWEGK
jgi:hypothetical protein